MVPTERPVQSVENDKCSTDHHFNLLIVGIIWLTRALMQAFQGKKYTSTIGYTFFCTCTETLPQNPWQQSLQS